MLGKPSTDALRPQSLRHSKTDLICVTLKFILLILQPGKTRDFINNHIKVSTLTSDFQVMIYRKAHRIVCYVYNTMWLLEIKLGPSGRAVGALSC